MTAYTVSTARAIVTAVTGGRDSGSALGSYLSNREVKVQLERSLLDNGLLGNAQADYRIDAKILDIEFHSAWFRLTVRCTIKYRVAKASGTEILADTILTENASRTAKRESLHQAIGLMGSVWTLLRKHGPLEQASASQPMRRGLDASLHANIERFIARLTPILVDQPQQHKNPRCP